MKKEFRYKNLRIFIDEDYIEIDNTKIVPILNYNMVITESCPPITKRPGRCYMCLRFLNDRLDRHFCFNIRVS